MKISYILFPLALASVVFATDYGPVTGSNPGGIFAVEDGEYLLLENDNFVGCYTEDIGGAIYVGMDATLELKGSLHFQDNCEYAWKDGQIWTGDANDIFLSEGATLILNTTGAGDVITLGSGVDSEGSAGTASIIKRGAGTANLGGAGEATDFGFFDGSLMVEEGSLAVKSTLNTISTEIAAGATLALHSVSQLGEKVTLNILKGNSNAVSIEAGDGVEATLSGVSMTATGLTATGEAKGLLEGVNVTIFGNKVSDYTIAGLELQDSILNLGTASATLSNIILGANAAISAKGAVTLSGENELTLGTVNSTQLSGVSLLDGSTLSITLTSELLDSMESTFDIILSNTQLAEGAMVNFTFTNTGLSLGSWESMESGLKFSMSHTIPEPATATLSLLALAGLALRRRRQY